MVNSPFYAAFERMWEHILNKFDNYVEIENLDELSETFELITVEDIDNICVTTPSLITFTVAGTSYQAEEGMTWAEWVDSSYNNDSDELKRIAYNESSVYVMIGSMISGVTPNDIIIPNHTYTVYRLN